MSTIDSIQRIASEKLADTDLNSLVQLAHRYAKTRNYFNTRFSSPDCLADLKYYRSTLRPQIVSSTVKEDFRLPARYWKLALDESISNIRSLWENCKNEIRHAASRNDRISEEEFHYINTMLCWDNRFEDILCHRSHTIPEEFKKLNYKRLDSLIRRYARKRRGATPYVRRERGFMLDSGLYKQKGNKLYVSSLEKHQRIEITMKSDIKLSGNIRLIIRDDGSVEIHRHIKQTVKPEKGSAVVGVDKGYSRMIATSSENIYGEELGTMLTAESDRLSEKNRKRNQYYAMARALEKSGDKDKADRIRQNNLGKQKYNRKKRKAEGKISSYINHEIIRFCKQEKPQEIVEENLDFTYCKDDRGKRYNRRMASWCKGEIKRSLSRHAEKNSIKITPVNAAYTSQQCSNCGCLGERNGKSFSCPHCNSKMDADINAAKNILFRKEDTEIRLYTNYKMVKDILLKRQQSVKETN